MQWNAELDNLIINNKKKEARTSNLINNIDIYNKLINKQNQYSIKVENLLKQRQKKQNIYNSLMKKLNKGRQIITDLNKQATRTFKDRNNATDRLDMYSKVSENQRSERELSLMLDKLRFQENFDQTKFISKKTNKRKNETSEKKEENEIEFTALRAEAENFIKYLMCYASDKNIANIIDNIFNMSTDNKSMFDLIMAMELQLNRLENMTKISRATILKKNLESSKVKRIKRDQLARSIQFFKDEANWLKNLRCKHKQLETEWEKICEAIEELCDLLKVDRSPLSSFLGHHEHPNQNNMVEYFKLMEHRVNEIIYWLYCAQDNCINNVYEELMSSGSEIDDFIDKDLDGLKKKQPNILTKKDPSTTPIVSKKLDLGEQVPTPCAICLENRFMADADEKMARSSEMSFFDQDNFTIGVCRFNKIINRNIDKDEDLRLFIHRNSDCPLITNNLIKNYNHLKRV
ncbi:uncharacterized protein LOC126894299 [Daktulosphaira vitifoliae]|uniref:uncharacterized protein LOC126894299 n=1 Tax=Daktulosphaira vitifoliae TaxID=58002 RepID=UPI0021AA7DFB|nr:uncharacterized protein LOC126894299 [Daktulosphaira vitifoliae]